MFKTVQEGVYYKHNHRPGNSLSIAFLKIGKDSNADLVGNALKELWTMYSELKKGITLELKGLNENNLTHGNLTVLIGYGHEMFSIEGNKKTIPSDFDSHRKFDDPDRNGGGPVLDGSRLSYSHDIRLNHAASDHLILQFIGDNEFITNRAIVETWKLLSSLKRDYGDYALVISRVYTGFRRQDNRGWLGFHDGVSNLATEERLGTVAIDSRGLSSQDNWIMNGTYLSFFRLEIYLDQWQKKKIEEQEKMIGRDKITGCPLIGIDNNGKPVKDIRCPVAGTLDIIERGNEVFRKNPIHGNQQYQPRNISDKELIFSHINRANPFPYSYRIFRQGFEYFEPLEYYPGFRTGLNFISFQNSPSKIFKIIKEGFSMDTIRGSSMNVLEDFFSVRSAGIFFVPPQTNGYLFPGEEMFFNTSANYHNPVRYLR